MIILEIWTDVICRGSSCYERVTHYLHHPFQQHLLFKCCRIGRQLLQMWKQIAKKKVLPATINSPPYSPNVHNHTIVVISLRVWELRCGKMHNIRVCKLDILGGSFDFISKLHKRSCTSKLWYPHLLSCHTLVSLMPARRLSPFRWVICSTTASRHKQHYYNLQVY